MLDSYINTHCSNMETHAQHFDARSNAIKWMFNTAIWFQYYSWLAHNTQVPYTVGVKAVYWGRTEENV
jgi:hypothetical protein